MPAILMENTACAADTPIGQLQSLTKSSVRKIRTARSACRIAGPRLNSNFDREFEPILKSVLMEASDLIAALNSGVARQPEELVALATGLDRVCKYLRVLLRGCSLLELDTRDLYSAALNQLGYKTEHMQHIADSFRESAASDHLTKAITAAIDELRPVSPK